MASWYDFLFGTPPPPTSGRDPLRTRGTIRSRARDINLPSPNPINPTTIGPVRPRPNVATIGPVRPPVRPPLQRFETMPVDVPNPYDTTHMRPVPQPQLPNMSATGGNVPMGQGSTNRITRGEMIPGSSIGPSPKGFDMNDRFKGYSTFGNSLLNFFGFGPKEDNVIDVEELGDDDIEVVPETPTGRGAAGPKVHPKGVGTHQTPTGRKPVSGVTNKPAKTSQLGIGTEPIPYLPTNTRSKILASFDPVLNYSPTGDAEEVETLNQEEMDDPNSPINLYRKHLQSMPQRQPSSKWEKFWGSLLTAGNQGDPTEALALMELPYQRQMQDWGVKEDALSKLADIDYKYNSPYQALRNDNLRSQIQSRDAGVGFTNRRLNIQDRNAQSRAALADARIKDMANSGWKAETDDSGQLVMYRMNPMSGQLEVQETGISTMEYLRFQETQSQNRFTRGATNTRLSNEQERIKGAAADREQRRKRDEALYGVPAK